jgi:hypothetical protein
MSTKTLWGVIAGVAAAGYSSGRSRLKARLAGAAAFLAALLAFGGVASAGVNFVCDASIGASLCTQINNTVDPLYGSTFSNANTSVWLTFGNTGLGGSAQYVTGVSYSDYLNALAAETNANSGVVRLDALNSLPTNEPALYNNNPIVLTSSLAAALGLSTGPGIDSNFNPCTLGAAGCYNGFMELASPSHLLSEGYTYYDRAGTETGSQFDIFSVIEHETDEILGTVSCVADVSSQAVDFCGSGVPSAADLYRYASPGVRSLTTTNPAYFSYDGGTTDVANYNTALNGGDFGDWNLQYACAQNYIQDAFACPGSTGDITNDGGPEINLLNSVGYNLATSVPEPATWTVLLLGIAAVGGTLRASRRRSPATVAT